jgi:DNA (cytosine-5)-methyltransferase 1
MSLPSPTILQPHPSFDPRNYGVSKLGELIRQQAAHLEVQEGYGTILRCIRTDRELVKLSCIRGFEFMKAVSLFSGCGGSDAGIISAGFDVVMANDKLAYARDVYLANHPATDYVLGYVAKIQNFPCADLLVGCYPCQGFSQGGVRNPDARINKLYLEFARALQLIRPKAFIVENVSGMVRKNFSHLLEDQFKVFTETGYKVKAQVLNSEDYGVPQERRRIFIVGIRDGIDVEYCFPVPTHGVGRVNSHLSIRDAIGHLPEWPEGEFYAREFHWYYMSRNRRQDWHQCSKTIVANPRHMPLHPLSPPLVKRAHNEWVFETEGPARRFSYREAARLQGFVDGFVFPDTSASSLDMRYKVAGNAVPPPLFRAVAAALPDIWD